MPRHHHILSAASTLLGIALLIITGLNVSGVEQRTVADEIGWIAATLFSLACLLSYLAIRAEPAASRCADWADRTFFAGLVTLVVAVLALAMLHI